MSELVKFKPDHLIPLLEQQINAPLKDWFMSGVVYDLEKSDAVSFIYKGEVMVCGGITKYWAGRGQLWAVFNENSKYNFVPTFRMIKHWLNHEIGNNYNRIELSVACDFEIGKRRAEMLGFGLECAVAKKYLPTGGDCSLYSMVRV
jgi:hypothetical protein